MIRDDGRTRLSSAGFDRDLRVWRDILLQTLPNGHAAFRKIQRELSIKLVVTI
jgi:hypothetical protein